MANTQNRTAFIYQQKALTALDSKFNGPNGEVDAESLFRRIGLDGFRGSITKSGKMGEIKKTSLEFIKWFVDEELIESRDATIGRGQKKFALKITEKGRQRLAELQRSISVQVEEPAELPKPATPKREPLQGVDEIAIQALKRKVRLIETHAAADLARRNRKQERKLRGGQNAG